MSKILHYLEAFSTQLKHIFQCVGWKVRGELESEGVGGDTEIKFASFQLSAPCSQMTLRELETLYKLQLPSHCRMPKKMAETISASL